MGKTAIAEGLAQRIVAGDVPPGLAGFSVLELDLPSLVRGVNVCVCGGGGGAVCVSVSLWRVCACLVWLGWLCGCWVCACHRAS